MLVTILLDFRWECESHLGLAECRNDADSFRFTHKISYSKRQRRGLHTLYIGNSGDLLNCQCVYEALIKWEISTQFGMEQL